MLLPRLGEWKNKHDVSLDIKFRVVCFDGQIECIPVSSIQKKKTESSRVIYISGKESILMLGNIKIRYKFIFGFVLKQVCIETGVIFSSWTC